MKNKKEMSDVKVKDFVIFKTGTWNGEKFTEQDLDKMVQSFDVDEPPHIIVGHSSDYKGETLIPSFGRILGGLKRIGTDLIACGTEFNDQLAGWIKDGFLTDRSIELTKDNQVLAVGMLGKMPPAVKKMPLMKLALAGQQFSMPEGFKTIEFADMPMIDEIEKIGTDDTQKDMAECCANFLKKIDAAFSGDVDEETQKSRIQLAVGDLNCELISACEMHFMFIDKLENIEEHKEEMAEKKGKLLEFAKQLFSKRKEQSNMDETERKEFTGKIAAQEIQLKEFAEQKRLADEQKAADEKKAKDEKLLADVKKFCVDNKLDTKLHKELKIEEILFVAAKANDTIEFSQDGKTEKKSLLVVLQDAIKAMHVPKPTEGEMSKEFADKTEKNLDFMQKIDAYIELHPKEFSGTAEQKRARAITLHTNSQIKI